MQELLEVAHAPHHEVLRRRDEARVSGPRAADPVLAAPELAGRLVRPAAMAEQDLVHLADQPEREREAAA
jgi:hypothetical protein